MKIDSRHLVDPELLDQLDRYPTVDVSAQNLAEIREEWATQTDSEYGVAAAPVNLSVRSVKGPAGAPDVGVRIYRPAQTSGRSGCIFHIHGGGYVGGDIALVEPTHRAISGLLGCVIVTVNYRLAPETRFPGNIEDCYAALSWLFEHTEDLGIDPQRIGVMGESAGGGLAAALALLARDRGQYRLSFQHLIYPMLDDRTCVTEDPHPFTGEFCWTAPSNYFGWSALLGKEPGTGDVSPYAAAARATSVAGLPRAFISTATLDLFLEENIEYARRLMRAGVPVELHVYPGSFHGFDAHPSAKIAYAARRDSLAALERFLGTS